MSLKFGKSWLLKLYRQLPYIVYRDAYLIPHPPPVPASGPSLAEADLFAFQKLLEYTQKYILPIKRINREKLPHLVFYEENKVKLLAQFKQVGQSFSFKNVINAFNALPYEHQDEYTNRQRDPTLVQFEKKYRIPNITQYRPHIVYLKATKQHPITPDKYKLFAKLPKNEKELYVKKAERLNKRGKKELQRFLSQLEINQKEFEHIRGVCKAIKEMAREIKSLKPSKSNQKAINSKKIEDIPSKQVQQILQNKDSIIKEGTKAIINEAVSQNLVNSPIKAEQLQVKNSFQSKQQPFSGLQLSNFVKIQAEPHRAIQQHLKSSPQDLHSSSFKPSTHQQQIVSKQLTKEQLQQLEYINQDFEVIQLKKLIQQALVKSKANLIL